MFFRVEVLWYPVDVQMNQVRPTQVARVVEHSVPLAALSQIWIGVGWPVLPD